VAMHGSPDSLARLLDVQPLSIPLTSPPLQLPSVAISVYMGRHARPRLLNARRRWCAQVPVFVAGAAGERLTPSFRSPQDDAPPLSRMTRPIACQPRPVSPHMYIANLGQCLRPHIHIHATGACTVDHPSPSLTSVQQAQVPSALPRPPACQLRLLYCPLEASHSSA
jgi:hypothetical protein